MPNSRVFYSDTDGVYATFEILVDHQKLISNINQSLKDKFGIRFSGEIEGTGVDLEYRQAMLFFTHKNYVYLDDKGKFRAKGSKLVSRSYPKISILATKKILEAFLKEDNKKARKILNLWKKVLLSTNKVDLFALTIKFKKQREYKDGYYKKLAMKFGEGYHTFFIGKKGKSSYQKYKPKPREQYDLIENFTPDKLDRNWYVWHLEEYMVNSVCGLRLKTKRLDEFF